MIEWRDWLASYSREWIRTADENELAELDPEQRAAGWLGVDGADEAEVAALERRLGVELAPDYRAFLLTSDGWTHPGPFMFELLPAAEVVPAADDELADIFGEDDELGVRLRRSVLISGEGDAQYWFLDPADGSAWTWSSWGFDNSSPSFFALMEAERASTFELRGQEGRPIDPDAADALTAEGRRLALAGEVDAALAALQQAEYKGSGLAAYLRAVLEAIAKPHGMHALRHVAAAAVERAEVDADLVRGELVPLYLTLFGADANSWHGWYLPQLGAALPGDGDDTPDGWLARAEAFTPPRPTEPPDFVLALELARELAAAGDPAAAYAVVAKALPAWRSEEPGRIFPVVLLTDPVLAEAVPYERWAELAAVPRG